MAVLPTGAGKTVVFAQIAYNAIQKGKSVLILVHRQEIFDQTIQKLAALDIYAGQILSGRSITKNCIKVGMIQTVANRLGKIEKPDLIIIDEGHHSTANSWKKVIDFYPDAIKLFFTATPERMDGSGFSDICDCLIEGKDIMWLISEGYLTFPKIYNPTMPPIPQMHIIRGDYDINEQAKYIQSTAVASNVIEYHRQLLLGKPTLSFVPNLAMGEWYQKIYRDAGISAQLIQGGCKHKKQRELSCKALSDGSLEILISCGVINEGFDVPIVIGCHMLRRTGSTGLYLQQGGRTTRPDYCPGMPLDTAQQRKDAIRLGPKPEAIILDFWGNSLPENHGHLVAKRIWSLDSKRKKPGQKILMRCPQCNYPLVSRVAVCPDPDCGYNFNSAAIATRKQEFEKFSVTLKEAIPGLSIEEIDKIANILIIEDKKKKQNAMIAYAFKYARLGEKESLEKLASLAGYKSNWVDWAWDYAKSKKKIS